MYTITIFLIRARWVIATLMFFILSINKKVKTKSELYYFFFKQVFFLLSSIKITNESVYEKP